MPKQPPSDTEAISRLNDRVAELEFSIAEQERQTNLMIRSFIHDIKNPLAVTLGSLQVAKLVEGKNLSPKAIRLLDAAIEGGAHQLAMIHNLSEQIKIEMGELTLIKEAFDPGLTLKKQIGIISQKESSRSFLLNESLLERMVLGDESIFERGVGIVLDHCIKHTNRTGSIVSETKFDEKKQIWTLTISDDGELLASEQLDNIFDRHKLPVIKNLGARRDIGMGLSYARTALRAMGGDLVAVENNGVGAKFVISLKCSE